MKNYRVAAALAVIFAGGAVQGQEGKISDADTQTVKVSLQTAQTALTAGENLRAESLCRAAIRILESNNLSSRTAHWLLGKVLLEQGKNDLAYEELIYEWRPGRFPTEDLFVAVAGTRAKKGWASTALESFLQKNDGGSALIGSREFLPSTWTGLPASVESSALILLAAMPETAPQDAVKYALQAEKKAHGFAITSFILGKAYSRLGQYDRAKECLIRASQTAPTKLKQLINEAVIANDASMKGSRS